MMTSLGMILKSLKPVIISDVNIDPQVYGEFIPPLRDDIPHSPDFIPVAGILGSAIAGAISTIDKFGIMIINAPEIIQQGLANAVYNVSKGVVGDIANNASDWINKPSGELASVRTKIIGNIF
jgi:hypothetical protein